MIAVVEAEQEQATAGPASLEAQLAELTRLYEARAYVIYNIGLRTTGESKRAMAAAEAAFLGLATGGFDESGLLPRVVRAAIAESARKVKPEGVADEDLALLRTTLKLAPPERAALALATLAESDVAEIGQILGVGEDAAATLQDRAQAEFAAHHGVAPEAVGDLLASWSWSAPPPALWERIYPAFRRSAERHGPRDQNTTVVEAVRPPRRWRRRMLAVATTLLAGAVTAGVLALVQRDSAPESPDVAPSFVAESPEPVAPDLLPPASQTGSEPIVSPVDEVQSKPHKPLTPEELDKLRLEELEALRDYQRRQTDERLTQAQRDYAARKVSEFQALARERADVNAQERRLAKRERRLALAEQRADARRAAEERRRQREQQEASQEPSGATAPATGPQPGSAPTPVPADDAPPTAEEAEQQCIQDADTGAYICPQ